MCLTPLLLSLAACESKPPVHAEGCRQISAQRARWFIASDSAGREFLDSYCVAVGPGVLIRADHPLPRSPGDSLIVINWNMALGAGSLPALVDDLRAGELGARSRDFVLLLQEAPRRSSAVPAGAELPAAAQASELDAFANADIVSMARQLGLHLLYVPSMRNGRDAPEDQGNAILSTLPLHDVHVYELPAGIRRRVAVSAEVEWPEGARLRLVSAHLDNWSMRRAIGSLGGIRARQAGGLAAMLPDDDRILLGADLNTWRRGPREAAFRILRRALPRPDTIDTRPTAVRVATPRKLDYLLLRAPATLQFTERRIDERYGSDHHPLIGVLTRS